MADQVFITDVNKTPLIQIITWLALITSVLAFCTHAVIKLYVFRALGLESWLVFVSLIFCGLQSAAVSEQAENGFGKPLLSLSKSELDRNFKWEYAGTMFFILSIGLSKLAIVAFIQNLTPERLHRRVNVAIGIVVSLWIASSVLVAAFQCSPPNTWDRVDNKCMNRLTWWNAISIVNIITEVAVVALEIGITVQLQVARRRKAAVISIFACRLFVTAVIIVQLCYFRLDSTGALKDDLTLGYWRSTLCTQIAQCVAIVTTCLPYVKIFMEGFDSGMLRLDDARRKRGEHGYGSKNTNSRREYELMDVSRSQASKTIELTQTWTVKVEPASGSGSSSESQRELNLRP